MTPERPMTPERLFADNAALAWYWAERLGANLRGALGVEDLAQVGLAELWRCARLYDPSRGAAFATYATACVRGVMLSEMRGKGTLVRVPESWTAEQRAAARALLSPGPLPRDCRAFRLDGTGDVAAPGAGRGVTPGERVERLLRRLDRRRAHVVREVLRGRTQAELAAELGVSRSRINQLYLGALEAMAS